MSQRIDSPPQLHVIVHILFFEEYLCFRYSLPVLKRFRLNVGHCSFSEPRNSRLPPINGQELPV